VGVVATDAVVMAAALNNQPEQARSSEGDEVGKREKERERVRVGMERQPGCPTWW